MLNCDITPPPYQLSPVHVEWNTPPHTRCVDRRIYARTILSPGKVCVAVLAEHTLVTKTKSNYDETCLLTAGPIGSDTSVKIGGFPYR